MDDASDISSAAFVSELFFVDSDNVDEAIKQAQQQALRPLGSRKLFIMVGHATFAYQVGGQLRMLPTDDDLDYLCLSSLGDYNGSYVVRLSQPRAQMPETILDVYTVAQAMTQELDDGFLGGNAVFDVYTSAGNSIISFLDGREVLLELSE